MKVYKRQLITSLVLVLAIFINLIFPAAKTFATPQRDVGIWYSTLYSADKNYIWKYGDGVGSDRQMTGNVLGTNKEDVVFFYNSNGGWYGLQSNGNGFNTVTQMTTGHGSNSTKQFVADVDGDGYSDAVAYWDVPGALGVWRVWYNNQNGGFTTDNTIRIGGFGSGSTHQFMADINGDGAADAVAVWPSSGHWVVALGTKNSQSGATLTYTGNYWKSGVGAGATKFLVGDVTGDQKADAVVITPTPNSGGSGDWNVSVNTGNYASSENNSALWISGHGVGSGNQFLADIDGGGKQDAVVMNQNASNNTYGNWYVAYSNYTQGCGQGVCFDASSASNVWLQRHGYNSKLQSYGYGVSNWQGFGDTDNDGKADPIVFHNNNGEWRVMPSAWASVESVRDPDQMNYWQANIIRYMPIVGGQMRQYDSGESGVIDEHLGQIGTAGINFLLLDLTNGPHGWYYNRGLAVCDRMQIYNQSHTPLKISLAIGGFQFIDSTDSSVIGPAVENEVESILNSSTGFINNSRCQGLFYTQNNKPLLTMYFRNEAQRNAWVNYTGSKTNSNQFTIKYTYGSIPYQSGSSVTYPCSTYNTTTACNTGMPLTSPASSEYGDFTGWAVPYGTLLNATNNTTAVVMPGWNTNNPNSSRFISRTINNLSDGFYKTWGWDKVNNLSSANRPTMVIINSFNEYAEETAVAPTETDNAVLVNDRLGSSEQWPWTTYFWDDTTSFVSQYQSN